MLLSQQFKPVRVSNLSQKQSLADRIKNKYLLSGKYPFRSLNLIWFQGNSAHNQLIHGPITINLKLLLEQRGSELQFNTSKLLYRSSAIADKPELQALPAAIAKMLSEHVYRQQLTGSKDSRISTKPDFSVYKSMLEKPDQAAWSSPGYNVLTNGHVRNSQASLAPLNNIISKDPGSAWRYSHLKLNFSNIPTRQALLGTDLSSTSSSVFSPTGHLRSEPSRQTLKHGLLPRSQELPLLRHKRLRISTPIERLNQPRLRSVFQLSEKESAINNSFPFRKWPPEERKTNNAVAPSVDTGLTISRNEYNPFANRIAGAHSVYDINHWSLNNRIPAVHPLSNLEAISLRSLIPAPVLNNRGFSNILTVLKKLPAQLEIRDNYYTPRQNQLSPWKKLFLDQFRQEIPSLATRSLLAGKADLKQIMPPGRTASANQQSGSLTAGRPVPSQTAGTQWIGYPVGLKLNQKTRVNALTTRSGQQLSMHPAYAQGDNIHYIDFLSGYYGGGSRRLDLQYLHSGLIDNQAGQPAEQYRQRLAADRFSPNIYRPGASQLFYPVLPFSAASEASGSRQLWQKRLKTEWINSIIPGAALYKKIIEPTRQTTHRFTWADRTLPGKISLFNQFIAGSRNDSYSAAPNNIHLVFKNMLKKNDSEARPNRWKYPVGLGEHQYLFLLLKKAIPKLKSNEVPMLKENLHRQPTSSLINNQPNVLRKLQLSGWNEPALTKLIRQKMLLSKAEDGHRRIMHPSADSQLLNKSQNKVGYQITKSSSSRLSFIRSIQSPALMRKKAPGYSLTMPGSVDKNDSTRNLAKARMKSLKQLNSNWINFNRDRIDGKIVKELKSSGFRMIPYGVDNWAVLSNKLGTRGSINNLEASKGLNPPNTNVLLASPGDILSFKENPKFSRRDLKISANRLGIQRAENNSAGHRGLNPKNTNGSLEKTGNILPFKENPKFSRMDFKIFAKRLGIQRAENNSAGHRGLNSKNANGSLAKTGDILPFKENPKLNRMDLKFFANRLGIQRAENNSAGHRGLNPKNTNGSLEKTGDILPFKENPKFNRMDFKIFAKRLGIQRAENNSAGHRGLNPKEANGSFKTPGDIIPLPTKTGSKSRMHLNISANQLANQSTLSNPAVHSGLGEREATRTLTGSSHVMRLKPFTNNKQVPGPPWQRLANYINKSDHIAGKKNYRSGLTVADTAWGHRDMLKPAFRSMAGISGRGILNFSGYPYWSLSSLSPDQKLDRNVYRNKPSEMQDQSSKLSISKDPPSVSARVNSGTTPAWAAGNNNRFLHKPLDQYLLKHKGIKISDDKHSQPYSVLATGPDLNYRRNSLSPANSNSHSDMDNIATSINTELKMQMAATRKAELNSNEIRKISDRVYREVQQRMKVERQRRGL